MHCLSTDYRQPELKKYIHMSNHSVHLRKRIGKVPQSNGLFSFHITHVRYFALLPTVAHVRARPRVVSCVRLQRSIPSSEIKLNDDKLS